MGKFFWLSEFKSFIEFNSYLPGDSLFIRLKISVFLKEVLKI
jgi:hypothetical protein